MKIVKKKVIIIEDIKKNEGVLKEIFKNNYEVIKIDSVNEMKTSLEALYHEGVCPIILHDRSKRLDDLTGIYNREIFYKKVQEQLKENPEALEYDIICLDVERFKMINDLYGTTTGDDLLKFIANYLMVYFEHSNAIWGRLYGDVFAIYMPRKEEQHFIEASINDMVTYPLNMNLIINYGIYNIHNYDTPVSVMCDRANMAIKTIKGNYARRYAIYDSYLREEVLIEHKVINEMSEALEYQQFIPYYQLKFNIVTNKVIGAEALIRWVHPKRGVISPSEFIPVFEKNGFISLLDRYMWEAVCKDIRSWMDEGKPVIPISVNVSRMELYNENLADYLYNLIAQYKIPVHLLQVEITETAYMENPHQLIESVNRLKEKGFIILMDDFGSGYSCLNTLKDVAVDVIKLDVKFSTDINCNMKGDCILKSIIQMGRRLGLSMIAEGVETQQQADFLKSNGCHRAQGYLYAKPLPKKEVEVLMSQNVIDDTDEDTIEALVNIEDIMSGVYKPDDIEWYRAAIMQMDAYMMEYDMIHDVFTLFDRLKEPGSQELIRLEIPNYQGLIKSGKFIYSEDIPVILQAYKNKYEGKLQLRIRGITDNERYHWYEVSRRMLYDEHKIPIKMFGVIREITKEKLSEQLMRILIDFEKTDDIPSTVNKLLPEIGAQFCFDRICIVNNEHAKLFQKKIYSWHNKDVQPLEEYIPNLSKADQEKLFKRYDQNGILILHTDDMQELSEEGRNIFLEHDVKTLVIVSIYFRAEYAGAMIFTNVKTRCRWSQAELLTLGEIAKCITSNIEKYSLKRENETYRVSIDQQSIRG